MRSWSLLFVFVLSLAGCQKMAEQMPMNRELEKTEVVRTTPEPSKEVLTGETVVRRADGSEVTVPGRLGKPGESVGIEKHKLNYGSR